ncbi:hypothetical protein DTO006G1_4537 [Penicillium roqueforti]|nr:hypothetical protein CBS147337_1027 [Penicillium roqueforti]KAI2689298.1 hypothetical protein LCP963914a_2387 [Penicillium roqueforti]KAI2760496.1 hypothetical protein DTO006G1_4537 [Penicillium roqueforti]KAI3143504.1 hypothetical protein CBS147330_1291 [Penicillium roqueforti]KAI3177066.1 hypothetical protein DTO039G3_425 [Penicillium roqueforti]
MAVPPIAKATLQAALISAGSNVLAQGIKSYRADIPFELDVESLTQFATCAIVISPLGYLWLGGLEAWFPGRESKGEKEKGGQSSSEPSLNATNTVAKIVIDQTVGGAWNTVLFITTMGMLRGLGYDAILAEIQEGSVSNADTGAGLLVNHVRWVEILAFGIDPQFRCGAR